MKNIHINAKVEYLIAHVANVMGISVTEMNGPSRRMDISHARFVAFAVLHRAGYSYPYIGDRFHKDHTSVLYGARKAEKDSPKVVEMLASASPIDEPVDEPRNPYTQSGPKKYAKVFEAYGGKCAVCGFGDIVVVHHIIPRSIGGGDGMENLIVLCPNHHGMLHCGLVKISKSPTAVIHLATAAL